jgi:hypothetical protein
MCQLCIRNAVRLHEASGVSLAVNLQSTNMATADTLICMLTDAICAVDASAQCCSEQIGSVCPSCHFGAIVVAVTSQSGSFCSGLADMSNTLSCLCSLMSVCLLQHTVHIFTTATAVMPLHAVQTQVLYAALVATGDQHCHK